MMVLIVEDDERVADALGTFLRRKDHSTCCATSGAAALAQLSPEIDAILLDLGLPDIDGFALCRQIRQRSTVPIIMATARSSVEDRIKGLHAGADDFVVKPYDARELIARIEAVTRRIGAPATQAETPPLLRIDNIEIDFANHVVLVDGQQIIFTPKEFDILVMLARYPGVAVPRERIIREVWGSDWVGFSRSLEVHIGSIRRKLGRAELIATVRGIGYRLTTQ